VSYHDITIAAIQIRNQVIIFDYDFKSTGGVMIELQNVSVSYGDAIALYPPLSNSIRDSSPYCSDLPALENPRYFAVLIRCMRRSAAPPLSPA
jgi:hypothetical protein